MKPVYIGTSGWSYKDWGKAFYPKEVPKSRQFEYYATQFPTVEINNTFYRLPTPKSVEDWRDKAPEDFLYAIKGSRFITHMKKLANLGDGIDNFFSRIKPLKKQIGVILWQLPPMLKKDAGRLNDFLRELPKGYRYAVEFRHVSWLDDEVFTILRKHHAAHVNLSSGGMPMDLTVTTNLIYIRFHGLAGGAAHDYARKELKPWAEFIHGHPRHTVFAYFNNDINTRAPGNAQMLMEIVGERSVQAVANPVLH
ncbi:MAG: hypothetical protein JWQ71_429 [Pedosphaera sp.]|nr:hypothetical protein [Pedosphaera sp.]